VLPKDIIRKIRRIEITTRKLVNDVFAGEYHSSFRGRGMEFEEVREYQPLAPERRLSRNSARNVSCR
jgi:hypothetical protein